MAVLERKHVFIVNPTAGRAMCLDSITTKIRTVMDALGLPYVIEITNAPLHATELVRGYMAGGGSCLFYACGGDGTLNEVACGAVDFPGAAVTHYPAGTGNDFIRQFGERSALFSDLVALAGGREQSVDMLQVGQRYCLNVFSTGFDAQVPADMRNFKWFSRFGSKMPYNLAVVSSIFKGMGAIYDVYVDGVDYSGEYTIITAMNGQYYGGGFHPAPDARVNDGLMDILLAKKMGVFGLAKAIGPYSKGQAEKLGVFTCMRAKSLQVKASKMRPVNLDGECASMDSSTVCVRPGILRFVTPKNLSFDFPFQKKAQE